MRDDERIAPTYRGVAWHKGHQKWIAKLKTHGRYVTLGYYDDAVFAARIYDCATRILRGPDGVLNFDGQPPPGVTTAEIKAMLIERGIIKNNSGVS